MFFKYNSNFIFVPNLIFLGMSSHLPIPQSTTIVTPLARCQDSLKTPVVKDFNPVVIVYRRPMFLTDELMRIAGAGEFTHCELHIPD